MSYIQQPVLPLSFSVERLLQHTKRSGNSTAGGSVGSSSDNESTPPSSPDPSCNSTDLQERQPGAPFKGQLLVNAPSFATLPCIPISALTWNPAALSPSTQQAPIVAGWRMSAPRPAVSSDMLYQRFNERMPSPDKVIYRPKSKHQAATSSTGVGKVAGDSKTQNTVLSPDQEEKRFPGELLLSHPVNYQRSTSNNSSSGSASVFAISSSTNSKKKRTTFSSSQLESLEVRFNQQKYLTKHDRSKLAASLGLTEKHIKTWYQNRRTKWKRECSDEVWSKERENAATAMYAQHLQLKSTTNNDDTSLMHLTD